MSRQIADIAREKGSAVVGLNEALQVIADGNYSLIAMREPYLGWVIKTERMYFEIIQKKPEMEFMKVENSLFPSSIT